MITRPPHPVAQGARREGPSFSELTEAETWELAAWCDKGVEDACEVLKVEDEAKRAWLDRASAGSVVPTSTAGMPEDQAKAAWLARASAEPTWLQPQEAAVLTEACDSGVEEACDALSSEEEAKKAWYARLAPKWLQPKWLQPKEAAMLTEECDSGIEEACDALSAEDAAKQAWLARLDQQPSWTNAQPAAVAQVRR